MTPVVALIPHDVRPTCCECSRPATHMAWDGAASRLCNTHLPAWMAWRGLRFNYKGAA